MSNIITVIHQKACEGLSGHAIIAKAIMSLVIEDKYDFREDRHYLLKDPTGETTGCGCKFCLFAHRYTQAKKEHHKTKARFYNDDYIFPTYKEMDRVNYYEKNLAELSALISELKQNKDHIKTVLCLKK